MKTVDLQPISDVQAVWQQTPSDGLAHALKVDDGFATPDDATTFLRKTTAEIGFDVLQLEALPPDLKVSTDYRLRAWVRASDANNTLAVAVFVDGADYSDPAGLIEWTARPLNAWGSFEATLTVPPTLHGDESIWLQLIGQVSTGSVDITQVELQIDYLPHHERTIGDCESLAPAAHIAGLAPEGSAASLAPVAAGIDLSPEATLASLATSAQAEGLADSGDASSRAPMATAANIHELTATPSSLAPHASGVAIAPEATGEARAPGGAEEDE